ncbi:hypothetical protein E6A55_32900 (plasmid) [Cupriavidus necator H16]|uniref:Uncharacterized protein n=1 Tax=Cupriavidus necator (strain ATCC 17699 / DSM 428 / KCTC 22496 / NCIMB 10442 / H16 / Stanier 337) TaxID=381666 RepID=A0AAF1D5C5_CUPNH|nr:hypothetical protein [Cupriavidus necator]QCC05397.1 hypothetical protein E6A55_32900 [Cupriavidus necator H16]QQB81566.1 hypothetical protein I6H87_32880 [Cupriavidus necator]
MSARSEARKRFIEQVQQALDEVEEALHALFEDPAARAEIIHTSAVPEVVRGWASQPMLNWEGARKKCSSATKSCFIGIRTRDIVCILSLIRVSKGGLLTKLLFLERDKTDDFLKGRGFVAIDVILDVIAAYFNSAQIVIDKPLAQVVPYYEQHGYRTAKLVGRSVSMMARPAKTR